MKLKSSIGKRKLRKNIKDMTIVFSENKLSSRDLSFNDDGGQCLKMSVDAMLETMGMR